MVWCYSSYFLYVTKPNRLPGYFRDLALFVLIKKVIVLYLYRQQHPHMWYWWCPISCFPIEIRLDFNNWAWTSHIQLQLYTCSTYSLINKSYNLKLSTCAGGRIYTVDVNRVCTYWHLLRESYKNAVLLLCAAVEVCWHTGAVSTKLDWDNWGVTVTETLGEEA